LARISNSKSLSDEAAEVVTDGGEDNVGSWPLWRV